MSNIEHIFSSPLKRSRYTDRETERKSVTFSLSIKIIILVLQYYKNANSSAQQLNSLNCQGNKKHTKISYTKGFKH